jgi:hypothetical protein
MKLLRFPVGSLLDRINAAASRHLARDHRDDMIGQMVLAVYEGLSTRSRQFRSGFFDVPLFDDGSITLGDTITTGLWQ